MSEFGKGAVQAIAVLAGDAIAENDILKAENARLRKVNDTDWLKGVIHAAMVSVGDCNRERGEVSEFIARAIRTALSSRAVASA